MTETKSDRRINRTRRQLREALMGLILEKGYNAVTIEDITERADLGRTTFYLHYRDKEELLLESLEAIAEDLKAQIEQLTGKNPPGAIRTRPVAIAFRHAAENHEMYRIILKDEGGTRASRRLREIISDAAIDFLARRMERAGGTKKIPVDVMAGYFASALLGFMTWWLENDIPYSADDAADMFTTLFFGGAKQFLSVPPEFGGEDLQEE